MSKPVKQLYEFGPFRLDCTEHTLLRNGQPISLRPKVFDILLLLVQNHGHLVEKEQLMNSVWAEQYVEEGNINKNISMLRQVLGEGDSGHKFIETVPKRGYRFVADVREMNEEGSDPVTGKEDASSDDTQPSHTQRTRVARFGRSSVVLLAVPALLLATLAYVIVIRGRRAQATPSIASIVVLPFQNLSENAGQEYFVDGITDALIGDLAKMSALRVISRTSAMHYKGTQKSLPEIAKELNVEAVVEGTVQRVGDRVHVRAQLIYAASDSHLWSADYDRDLRDVLDLQSEIARAIAGEVRVKVTPAEQRSLVPKRVVAREAIDNYLQGRYFLNKRTEQEMQKAIGYFDAAIKADSNYAQAYAGLADCYNQLGTALLGVMPALEARRIAQTAAKKALEIDNDVAEAHAALGYVNYFNWNWSIAEEEFKRSIELNPNNASAHSQYAYYLAARQRFDQAFAEINHAQDLDPLSLVIRSNKGFILLYARRYEEAIEQLRRVLAIDPNYYQANWALALTYVAAGQIAQAITTSEKAVAVSDRAPAALGVLGLTYGIAERKREANKILDELRQLQKQRYVTPLAFAYVYMGLRNEDQAFAWLEKGYEERSNNLAFFKVSPTVDALRSNPRFADLLRRIGLASEDQ